MKKHRFRAMTWEEVCKKQKSCTSKCPAFTLGFCGVGIHPDEPARLKGGKYLLMEVKE